MTRRRWIADEVTDNRAALVGEHAQHLSRVLRVRVGQEFDLAADGIVRRARVSAVSPDRVEFELGAEIVSSKPLQLTLALAIYKFDRLEWAIEKCTELGVSRIVPLIASRTDVHLARAAQKRRDRWQRIAREASEQSRRAVPPEITVPWSLNEAVALPTPARILLDESKDRTFLADVFQDHSADQDIVLAVGPEGGWTEAEKNLFRQSGWIAVSLGQTILRAETAAIAATAIVKSMLQLQ